MIIGLFGGTFNPPHLGHLTAARTAVKSLGLDKLFVIPAGRPPHKPLPPDCPGPRERLELTRLMFAGETGVEVSDMELEREGPSYSVDTALELAGQYPGAELYLLVGTDMLQSLETWHRAEDLLKLVTPAVFARAGGEGEAIMRRADRLREKFGTRVVFVDHDIVEASSTAIREGLSGRGGRALLDDRVYGEIIRRRYYGAAPDLDWLRERGHAMLKATRVPHVVGCEQEAAALARRWGADENLAREAAILHDCTKCRDIKEQLLLCENYDIITDIVERTSSKLLHAKTGAAIARDRFGVGDEVYWAIYYHTTGRPDMTLLDKVLYMADYIEPTRDFPEVHAMRRLAYSDLDAAVKYGLELSIVDLQEAGITPHSRTRDAIAWYTKGE